MATQIERLQTILEALKNDTVDQALMLRVADAFVEAYYEPDRKKDPPDPWPEDLTNVQRATISNKAIRQYVKDLVIGTETRVAAEEARDAIRADPPDLGTNSA